MSLEQTEIRRLQPPVIHGEFHAMHRQENLPRLESRIAADDMASCGLIDRVARRASPFRVLAHFHAQIVDRVLQLQ